MPGVLERWGEGVHLWWWWGWRCLGERERQWRGLGVEDGYGRKGGFPPFFFFKMKIIPKPHTHAQQDHVSTLQLACYLLFFFFRHGGPPPKALLQSGLTTGKAHGEPKCTKDRGYCTQSPTPRVLIALH